MQLYCSRALYYTAIVLSLHVLRVSTCDDSMNIVCEVKFTWLQLT